ncbi:hypothetical protein QL285_057231 [Trifolium repens]|nr:hypothetical protein QL285_057231 [Trifolium repens]
MITGRLRPVIKLVLGFGFVFGNENQITCTRSNQQAFGNELLAYENGLLLCLEKVLGTNRIKLGLVGKWWCELLSFAVMTGATRRASVYTPGRVSQVMTTRQGELQSELDLSSLPSLATNTPGRALGPKILDSDF